MLVRVCHVTALLAIVILICNGFFIPVRATSEETQSSPVWFDAKTSWKLQQLSKQQTRQISNLVSIRRLRENILPYLLYPRSPGSPGNAYARRTITTIMRDVLKWDVQYDTFVAATPRPYRRTSFSNIIATYDPSAKRRLVLACHYDTKVRPRNFVGATDSAVPCSIMIEIAVALRNHLKSAKGKGDLTLQLLFFDGEEAFVRWSETDSLYGSRHLAQLWQDTSWPENQTTTDRNKLDSIDLLTLLDLLGASNPKFYNNQLVKSKHFEDLIRIEKLMFGTNEYFQEDLLLTFVEDDHIPFYLRNVSVLHVIPDPFPRQWHTSMDNGMNLDNSSIKKLADIFAVFVAEYLHLNV